MRSSAAKAAKRVASTRASPYRGFTHAVAQIAREEGFAGFYRGLLPSLLLVRHIPVHKIPHAVSGYASGQTMTLCRQPFCASAVPLSAMSGGLEVSQRQKRQHSNTSALPQLCDVHLSSVHAILQLTLTHLQVSHGAIQFMVYEELKRAAHGPLGARVGAKPELSSAQISVMGAASKLVASIATYPSQVWLPGCMPLCYALRSWMSKTAFVGGCDAATLHPGRAALIFWCLTASE